MTRKFACALLLILVATTGCDRVKSLIGKAKEAEAPVAQATPTPTPTPEATPDAVAAQQANPAAKQPVDTHAEVVTLCYHRIEGKAGGALSIEPAEFEREMQAIKDAGLTVISMSDFLAWRRGEKNIPAKSVLITIDDGYVSGYEVAWPVLKKYGYPFTMFVYLKYIGVGGKSISWDKLEEMRDAGVDIGCHTISHQDLRRKPGKATEATYEEWLKNELEVSKKTIEDRLGIKVTTIAYPFGLHNQKVHDACKAAGYEAAFTTYGQRLGFNAPPMALGRYDVTTKDAQGRSSFDVAISFQGMEAPGSTENMFAQDAAASMVTQPMNNETINNPKPLLKANLSTMGNLDPASIDMRVSGIGKVDAKFDPATKMLTFQVNQPLKPGEYTVIIGGTDNGRKLQTRWSFKFDPSATASAAADTTLPAAGR